MQPIKIISVILVTLSLIGGGGALYYYSLDTANTETPFFQILLTISAGLFFSGIGLAFLAKKKPNFINDVKEAYSQKKEEAPVKFVNAPSMNVPAKGPDENPALVVVSGTKDSSTTRAIVEGPAKELSFEEEMALRKKQYYSEATKAERVAEKAAVVPPQAAPSPTPQRLPNDLRELIKEKPPEKVTIKFEPFKKKIDPLRAMLDREEESAAQAENSPWNSR